MAPWMIIALSVAAVLVLLFLLLRWAQRGLAAARANLTEVAAGRTARRQSAAHSFGIRSKGAGQLRGAGYLALVNGGSAADRLVAASSPAAGRVEVHEMRMDGSVMRVTGRAIPTRPEPGSIATQCAAH